VASTNRTIQASQPRARVKGKGKAKAHASDTQAEAGLSSAESLADTRARLIAEPEVQIKVRVHPRFLLNVLIYNNQSYARYVCLDIMCQPYALVPCGHLACYGCLVRWFTSKPAYGDAPAEHQRKNICSLCAVIKYPPAEVWGFKSIIAGLSKSGLLPGCSR
jgi:hypothetical protein